jgi:hypothetical protein
MNEPVVRRYSVDVCDPCIKLEGQECHTPRCIFYLHDIEHVKRLLSEILIAPVIDGQRFVVQKGRRVGV